MADLSHLLGPQANANLSPIDSDYEDEPEFVDVSDGQSTSNLDTGSTVGDKGLTSYTDLGHSKKFWRRNLLLKLQRLTHRYYVTNGKQVVVIVANPESEDSRSRLSVVGSQPLRRIVKNAEKTITKHFLNALNSYGFREDVKNQSNELPALIFDGINTSVAAMNQSQLRSLIPLIIKHSTSRRKPQYGMAGKKPCWWPDCVPWRNIRLVQSVR